MVRVPHPPTYDDGPELARHRASVLVLADPVELPALVGSSRCYVPMYLGVSGWVGVHLDRDPDWDEVAKLVETSYRLTAGARRVHRLDALRSGSP